MSGMGILLVLAIDSKKSNPKSKIQNLKLIYDDRKYPSTDL